MTPRPRQIVLDAIQITSSADRSAFLLRECGDDVGLRRQVEQLLHAHGIDDGFLETPAAAMAETISSPAAAAATSNESPGDLIGDYKLIERIGEGGMGSVWMAEQQRPVRRMVALKLIKAGMDTRAVLARFEAERQALALMDHPNIAKVLDAGQSAGRPYFVMELVKGTPITTYCDANHLTARQRLDLFVPVCHAIQHAHQKGVIHRDIKPSNVLVALYDDKPVPKVIDFGVAKAAGQPLTEMTLHTGYGSIIGTPEYMSPEQATFNQLDIDTRSDVYSLGVLLYELLTGTTPVDKTRLKQAALLEVLRLVREEEPPRPSVKLSTSEAKATIAANRSSASAELSQQLRGELDWIVMKSLEKDRGRRYETAAALGRDVERYLRDELVEARPPSLGYRFGKFLRRNRGPMIAAAAVAVALVVGVIGTTAGMLRSRAAEREASLARNVAVEGLHKNVGLRLILQSELTRPSDPGMALLLAIEGAERNPGLHANNALLAALNDNREMHTLLGHTSSVGGLSFSADGKRLLTASLDGSVRIWDVDTGKERLTLADEIVITVNEETTKGTIHFKPLYVAARFSPDGTQVLATSISGRYRVWDAATGKALFLLQTPDPRAPGPDFRPIAPAVYSADGRYILTGYGEARLWDARTGVAVKTLDGKDSRVNWAEFSADGSKAIVASADAKARVWDVASGHLIQTLDGPKGLEVVMARFSPDGRRALTVSEYGSHITEKVPLCLLWDVDAGKSISSHGGPRGVGGIAPLAQFTPSGDRLLTADIWGDSGLHLSMSADGRPFANSSFDRQNSVAAVSTDGRWIATSAVSTTIDLRSDSLTPVEQLRGHRGGVQALAFSPDGQFLASSDGAGVVRLWIVGGDAERRAGRWARHRLLATSRDGKLFATATEDKKGVEIWDAATGQERIRIPGEGFQEATYARFSPDGSRIFFGMRSQRNMSACVGDVATGKLVAVLPMGQDYFSHADISPDSAYAATVTDWHNGCVWNLQTGTQQSSWKLPQGDGHKGPCVFSPDSRSLVTPQASGPRLRDPATGRELKLLREDPPLGYVGGGATFSPDGRLIVTWHHRSQANYVAQVWDAASQKVVASLAGGHAGGGYLEIFSAEFSPDGREIIASCSDNTARVWDVSTGKQQRIFGPHQFGVAAATFSADGKLALTASEQTVRIYDRASGSLLATNAASAQYVTFARFLPDGRVLSADAAGAARVWPLDALAAAKATAPRKLTDAERVQYNVPAGTP